jgi:hypothetical protein
VWFPRAPACRRHAACSRPARDHGPLERAESATHSLLRPIRPASSNPDRRLREHGSPASLKDAPMDSIPGQQFEGRMYAPISLPHVQGHGEDRVSFRFGKVSFFRFRAGVRRSQAIIYDGNAITRNRDCGCERQNWRFGKVHELIVSVGNGTHQVDALSGIGRLARISQHREKTNTEVELQMYNIHKIYN